MDAFMTQWKQTNKQISVFVKRKYDLHVYLRNHYLVVWYGQINILNDNSANLL